VALAAAYVAIDKGLLRRGIVAAAPASRKESGLPVQPTPAPQSIAVLPFVDMSEKHDQEYFSDGLAEELLNLLAKTPGLHVIARTSSFYFKGKQVTIAEIARTLGVANILQGSVRKSGSHVRVSTQLIVASSGEEVWSEIYSLEFKDVFKV
jgi:TolB-like protein